MIDKDEINRQAEAQGLRFDQIEKDYVILWILRALEEPGLRPVEWVFKGGTCLRNCYYAGYRFSEDLDFSCRQVPDGIDAARKVIEAVVEWVRKMSFLRLAMKSVSTIEGDFQVEIPVEFSRGGPRRHGLPEVKLHLTFDEPILTETALRQVTPVYSDLDTFAVSTYSKKEILAEKMRALLQQQLKWARPRDLYDLWFILCHEGESFDWGELRELFIQKCQVRKVNPDLGGLVSEELRALNAHAWARQLDSVMAMVPDYQIVWREWHEFCGRVFGAKSI
jgi:predicted nucleotidyltransferase component of viral defense system